MQGSTAQRAIIEDSPKPVDLAALCDLAAAGLVPMFDAQKLLFCHRLKRTRAGLFREGLSPRYTMMALLGLHRYAKKKGESAHAFDAAVILDHLLQDTGWIDNLGDLGLAFWTCAATSPQNLMRIYAGWDLDGVLEVYPDGRERHTMELAWFLTGLSEVKIARPREIAHLTQIATRTYELLKRNQGSAGFFGHSAKGGSMAGMVRGHIGSFADQVYPIYALTKAHRAFEFGDALERARSCGEAIVRVQGALGQWWWHYDASHGAVVQQYPVYSVHQDGMAPMALFALEEATGWDVREPVFRGLRWITGANELGCDLRNEQDHVIWRSVFHKSKYGTRLHKAIGFLRGNLEERNDDLVINFECRPYHLGWLLYALSDRA